MTGEGQARISDEVWASIKFEDAFRRGRVRVGKVNRSDYLAAGRLPVIDQGQSEIAGYTNDESLAYDGQLPVIIFGDHTRAFKFVTMPFVCGADGTKVLVPNEEIFDPRF